MEKNQKEQRQLTPFPVINFQDLDGGETEYIRIGKEILKYFEEYGFVYLKNYGMSHAAIENLSRGFDEFFDLSEETKFKYYRSYENFQGYSTDKEERILQFGRFDVTCREAFDIQGLNLPMPDEEIPKLRELSKICLEVMYETAKKTLRAIDLAMDAPTGLFFSKHSGVSESDNLSDLRCIRYQPVGLDTPDQVIRLEDHQDIGTLTFHLFDDAGGLQVLNCQGMWQEVLIPAGFLLLFPGRILQALTDGKIKATTHRVGLPKKEARNQYRRSIIFFAHPNNDAQISPLDSHDKPISISFTAKEFILEEAKLIYKKFSENDNDT